MWIQAVWVTRCNNCWRNYKKSLVKDAAARLSLLEMCVFIWALTVSAWVALLRGRLCVFVCVCACWDRMNMPLFIFHLFQQSWFHRQKMKKKKKDSAQVVCAEWFLGVSACICRLHFWERSVSVYACVCVYLCARTRTGNRDISGLFGARRQRRSSAGLVLSQSQNSDSRFRGEKAEHISNSLGQIYMPAERYHSLYYIPHSITSSLTVTHPPNFMCRMGAASFQTILLWS